MQRFKNILVVADSADKQNTAFERSAGLALRNRALLTVACVVESVPEADAGIPERRCADLQGMRIQEVMIQEDLRRLETLIAPLRDAGVEVQTRILRGTPFLEIIREVLRNQHDLVMMTADGESGLTGALFGSTSIHLMRKCPCPVWVIKPAHAKFYARILAAVDPHPSDRELNALNIKIIELAASLARAERSELYIVHTWNASRISSLGTRYSRGNMEPVVSDVEQEHVSRLNELLQLCPLDDVRHQVHLLEGDAGDLIPAMARRKRADVIVMGTVCRTGVAGFFIGNTAEKVLRQVDCSVLTVKPDTFVTPVKLDSLESAHAA
jgi:nucleotide-binding universal stress UspA family protein